MANLSISILDNFLSGGSVGNNFLKSVNATLNASTRIRSRVAWAVRYFCVARRRRRRSSRDSPTKSDGCNEVVAKCVLNVRRRGVCTIAIFSHSSIYVDSCGMIVLLIGTMFSMSYTIIKTSVEKMRKIHKKILIFGARIVAALVLLAKSKHSTTDCDGECRWENIYVVAEATLYLPPNAMMCGGNNFINYLFIFSPFILYLHYLHVSICSRHAIRCTYLQLS